MSDVFILGAGFSKAVSRFMPVLTELSHDVSEGLVEKSPTKTLGKSLFAQFPKNIELWMTYLAQSHPWLSEAENLRNRAAFSDMAQEVNECLSSRTKQTVAENCPDWLTRLVTKWHDTQTPVLSLNYDTLVERCAVQQKLRCLNIYPIPLVHILGRQGVILSGGRRSLSLYKLHGSINWRYSGATEPIGETIYYIDVAGWKMESPDNQQEQAASDKVPFIVPPLTEKGPFFHHETVRSMWRQGGDALESADRIFILGYSLPQADLTMRYFLMDKARAGEQTFFLVNTDTNVQKHFQTLLENHFDINGDFICEKDPIPKFVERYVSGAL
jgi:hypothetical protein